MRTALLLVLLSAQTHAFAVPQLLRQRAATFPSGRGNLPSLRAAAGDGKLAAEDEAELVAIAGPAVLNTLLDPFLSVIDTFWVSRLGVIPLGAVAASSELFTMCIAASLALRESASSTIARLNACGRDEDASRFAIRTLQLALVVGLLMGIVLGGPSAPWACGLMGCHSGSPLQADALAYVRTRAVALPCALAISATEGIFRGMGDTRAPLRAAGIAALLNFVLDPLLMVGPLRLGVAGAAAATGIAQATACVLLIRTLSRRLRADSGGDGRGSATASGPPEAADGAELAEMCSPDADKDSARTLLGTSACTLTRTTAVIGCWVFIAASISRQLGPAAIAAHGVVLKIWLLLVLAAEAPAVAGQVLCARAVSVGDNARARTIFKTLLRRTAVLGVATAGALLLMAQPIAGLLLAGDPATAASACRTFRWAAAVTPFVAPNALCEAVLLGAGRSYKFLALSTTINAVLIGGLVTLALSARPALSSAWACILLFFVLRISVSLGRIFGTNRSGM